MVMMDSSNDDYNTDSFSLPKRAPRAAIEICPGKPGIIFRKLKRPMPVI